MYNARIDTDKGKTFRFGYQWGTLFDISPLTGANIDIDTSQNFQQVRENVEVQSTGGVTRTIKGTCLNATTAKLMIKTLPIYTTGKLYFNDSLYCNITIKKTPDIVRKQSGKYVFSMSVFCDDPFWHTDEQVSEKLVHIIPSFSFPTTFDEHIFGSFSDEPLIVRNDSDVPRPLDVSINVMSNDIRYIRLYKFGKSYSTESVINGDYSFIEVYVQTGYHIAPYTLRIFWENGFLRVYAVYYNVAGIENKIDLTGSFSFHGDFIQIDPGDNIFKLSMSDGEKEIASQAIASINFSPVYMGVIDDDSDGI